MKRGASDGPQPRAPKPVAGWAGRATPLVFLVLSLPTLGQLLGNDLPFNEAVIRLLVTFGVAMLGMHLLDGLVHRYAAQQVVPEPEVVEVAVEPEPARRADDPQPA